VGIDDGKDIRRDRGGLLVFAKERAFGMAWLLVHIHDWLDLALVL
jgi:hypothetical protein